MSTAEQLTLAGQVFVGFVIIIGGGYLLIMKFLKSISKARDEELAKETERFRLERIENRLKDMLTLAKKSYSLAINLGAPGSYEKTPEQADYWKKYDLMVHEFGKTLIQIIIEEDSSQKFIDLKQNLKLLDGEIFVRQDMEKIFISVDFKIKKMIEDSRTIDEIMNYFKSTIDEHGFITHVSGLTSFHSIQSFDSVFNTP